MITIIEYKQGKGKLIIHIFDNLDRLLLYIEEIRHHARPDVIVFSEDIIETVSQLLWTPQLMYIKNNELYGGMEYTRRYIKKILIHEGIMHNL
jgi:hypothetical protein